MTTRRILRDEVLSPELRADVQMVGEVETPLDFTKLLIAQVGQQLNEPTHQLDYAALVGALERALITGPRALSFVRLARFCLSQLIDPTQGATKEGLLAELRDLATLEAPAQARLGRMLDDLAREAEPLLANARRVASEETGPPSFNAMSAVVDLRGVNARPYRWEEPSSRYTPDFREWVPRATITLTLSRAEPSTVAFQLTRAELDLMTGVLEALRRDMDEAEEIRQWISTRPVLDPGGRNG